MTTISMYASNNRLEVNWVVKCNYFMRRGSANLLWQFFQLFFWWKVNSSPYSAIWVRYHSSPQSELLEIIFLAQLPGLCMYLLMVVWITGECRAFAGPLSHKTLKKHFLKNTIAIHRRVVCRNVCDSLLKTTWFGDAKSSLFRIDFSTFSFLFSWNVTKKRRSFLF